MWFSESTLTSHKILLKRCNFNYKILRRLEINEQWYIEKNCLLRVIFKCFFGILVYQTLEKERFLNDSFPFKGN